MNTYEIYCKTHSEIIQAPDIMNACRDFLRLYGSYKEIIFAIDVEAKKENDLSLPPEGSEAVERDVQDSIPFLISWARSGIDLSYMDSKDFISRNDLHNELNKIEVQLYDLFKHKNKEG